MPDQDVQRLVLFQLPHILLGSHSTALSIEFVVDAFLVVAVSVEISRLSAIYLTVRPCCAR